MCLIKFISIQSKISNQINQNQFNQKYQIKYQIKTNVVKILTLKYVTTNINIQLIKSDKKLKDSTQFYKKKFACQSFNIKFLAVNF